MKNNTFLIFFFFSSIIVIPCKIYSSGGNGDTLLQQEHIVGFIENKGQVYDQSYKPNAAVLYLLNRPGLNIQLRKTGFSYDTYTVEKKAKRSPLSISHKRGEKNFDKFHEPEYELTYHFHRVDIELPNANPTVRLKAEEPFPDHFNYYNEVTPEEGATGVNHYKKIIYQNIYENIDLVFSIEKGKPEYDFIIHPGGNVKDIVMQYKGMDNLKQNNLTELGIALKQGILTDAIPMSYELENKKEIAVAYILNKENKVSFEAKGYNRPLS